MTVKQASINQSKYDKENTIRYSLKLNKNTDKKLIDLIELTSKKQKISKQKAIKYLILY